MLWGRGRNKIVRPRPDTMRPWYMAHDLRSNKIYQYQEIKKSHPVWQSQQRQCTILKLTSIEYYKANNNFLSASQYLASASQFSSGFGLIWPRPWPHSSLASWTSWSQLSRAPTDPNNLLTPATVIGTRGRFSNWLSTSAICSPQKCQLALFGFFHLTTTM